MDVLQTKLAKRHGELAKEIKELLIEAQNLGATEGVLRMELVCDQYDKVLPDVAYNWLNLNEFQHEIEDTQSHSKKVHLVDLMRNVLAVAPLIFSWVALYDAVNAYHQNLLLHPRDITVPFLELWQEGFHGLTPLTFTVDAGIVTMLLVLFVSLILLSQELDRRAVSIAAKFIRKLRATTGKLIEAIITDSSVPSFFNRDNLSKNEQKKQNVSDIEKVVTETKTFEDFSNIKVSELQPSIIFPDIAIDNTYVLHIRIVEEPLTGLNFNAIMSNLTELHTKCWLIQQKRFADLIYFSQTHNTYLIREAGLVITKLTHNSPTDIKLAQSKLSSSSTRNSPVDISVNVDASPKGIMEALATAIDAVIQAPLRYRATKLEIRDKELAMNRNELESQTVLADKEQSRHLEVQNAALERQKKLLEVEKQQIEIDRQRLVLQEERLELEKKRIEYALETASKMIDTLRPGIDETTKAMLAQALLPNLLQLGNCNGLELALPEPGNSEIKTKLTENK